MRLGLPGLVGALATLVAASTGASPDPPLRPGDCPSAREFRDGPLLVSYDLAVERHANAFRHRNRAFQVRLADLKAFRPKADQGQAGGYDRRAGEAMAALLATLEVLPGHSGPAKPAAKRGKPLFSVSSRRQAPGATADKRLRAMLSDAVAGHLRSAILDPTRRGAVRKMLRDARKALVELNGGRVPWKERRRLLEGKLSEIGRALAQAQTRFAEFAEHGPAPPAVRGVRDYVDKHCGKAPARRASPVAVRPPVRSATASPSAPMPPAAGAVKAGPSWDCPPCADHRNTDGTPRFNLQTPAGRAGFMSCQASVERRPKPSCAVLVAAPPVARTQTAESGSGVLGVPYMEGLRRRCVKLSRSHFECQAQRCPGGARSVSFQADVLAGDAVKLRVVGFDGSQTLGPRKGRPFLEVVAAACKPPRRGPVSPVDLLKAKARDVANAGCEDGTKDSGCDKQKTRAPGTGVRD